MCLKKIKNRKHLLKLLIVAISIISLSSCNDKDTYKDTDFDGLYDNIDPSPKDNTYNAKFIKTDIDEGNYTNEISFTMDYRKIIDHQFEFNPDVALVAAMLCFDSEGPYEKSIITKNPFYEKDSTYNLCHQFGIIELETYTITGDIDQFDSCYLCIGNHKLIYNNVKYQVFFPIVYGYSKLSDCASNFDLCADTPSCKEVTGEHFEWLDKKNHKGFDVAANRAYTYIKNYIAKYTDNDFISFVFGCGQSRGASILNLIAKRFTDEYEDILSSFYCLNPALTTTNVTSQDEYPNILNFVCKEDITTDVPIRKWGFTLFGHCYYYSHYENLDHYLEVKGEEPNCIKPNMKRAMLELLSLLSDSREELYEFSPVDEEFEIFSFTTLQEAENKKAELLSLDLSPTVYKCCKIEIQSPTETNGQYNVRLITRPCILIPMISEIFAFINRGSNERIYSGLVKIILRYLPLVTKYIKMALVVSDNNKLTTSDFVSFYTDAMQTHHPLSTIISIKFSHEKNK